MRWQAGGWRRLHDGYMTVRQRVETGYRPGCATGWQADSWTEGEGCSWEGSTGRRLRLGGSTGRGCGEGALVGHRLRWRTLAAIVRRQQ